MFIFYTRSPCKPYTKTLIFSHLKIANTPNPDNFETFFEHLNQFAAGSEQFTVTRRCQRSSETARLVRFEAESEQFTKLVIVQTANCLLPTKTYELCTMNHELRINLPPVHGHYQQHHIVIRFKALGLVVGFQEMIVKDAADGVYL